MCGLKTNLHRIGLTCPALHCYELSSAGLDSEQSVGSVPVDTSIKARELFE